jgi:LmbE family N-acetylglucosaminyl deacetylase
MAPNATAKYTPERVLVIVAHPDDIEFGCAGTLARWIRDGATARYVLCTSGQVGIKDPSISMEEAARTRETEQTNAARAIGVQDVIFLHYQDGILENTMTLRKQLVREIRRFRPEVLICQDPTALFVGDNYINHPDHRAAGAAALDAVFPAAGMPALYQELEDEGLEAHETRKVYVSTWQNANTYVDITDTIDLKIASLKAHTSQMGDWDPTDRIRDWAAERAKGFEFEYAETFKVISLRTDEEWARCKGYVLPDHCLEPETETEAMTGASR